VFPQVSIFCHTHSNTDLLKPIASQVLFEAIVIQAYTNASCGRATRTNLLKPDLHSWD